MKDVIGDRMKESYENITKIFLPKKCFTIIRIDGKAFHTLTKRMRFTKPFDTDFRYMMNETTKFLCENIQGAIFGYTQSDEISIILQDFKNKETSAWFNGNIQKIASVSASLATAKFNDLLKDYISRYEERLKEVTSKDWLTQEALQDIVQNIPLFQLAFFDSRCFTISKAYEVQNYLLWRQKDCIRNSILSLAQSVLGKKSISNKNCSELKNILIQEKNIDWEDLESGLKYGSFCFKTTVNLLNDKQESYIRTKWIVGPAFDLLGLNTSIFVSNMFGELED